MHLHTRSSHTKRIYSSFHVFNCFPGPILSSQALPNLKNGVVDLLNRMWALHLFDLQPRTSQSRNDLAGAPGFRKNNIRLEGNDLLEVGIHKVADLLLGVSFLGIDAVGGHTDHIPSGTELKKNLG